MKIITDIISLRTNLKHKLDIAFVPTMGNLHNGHLSLIRKAKQQANCIVVSIFVNRLQFLPNEDFNQYPRTFEEDCRLLKNLDVDFVFAPDEKTLYPIQQAFLLELPHIANILEGKFRPGFFRGVTTVILKLFNIVQPQIAIFGKKDYQQLQITREMVQQLNFPIEIIACETVRFSDGLALSSRNHYLNEAERIKASYLYQSLLLIKQAVEKGNRNFESLQEEATNSLVVHGWKVDYLAIQQRNTFTPALMDDNNLIVLGAAWLGKTRLIDNIEI